MQLKSKYQKWDATFTMRSKCKTTFKCNFFFNLFEMKLNAKQLRAMRRKRGREVERMWAKRAANSGCKKDKEEEGWKTVKEGSERQGRRGLKN